MKWILLALIALVFVTLLFRTEPAGAGADWRSRDSLMGRFGTRFRPEMDRGDLSPGCFDPGAGRFDADPICVTRVQCSQKAFRYLEVAFSGIPAQVDFEPIARPDAETDRPRKTCEDDGGLSKVSLKLKKDTDQTVLVIPKSGGTITVTCLPPQLACTVRAR